MEDDNRKIVVVNERGVLFSLFPTCVMSFLSDGFTAAVTASFSLSEIQFSGRKVINALNADVRGSVISELGFCGVSSTRFNKQKTLKG